MTREEVDKAIDQWFIDRGIAENGTLLGQATKCLEEVTEIFDAISTGNRIELMDAIGDVYVTLRGLVLIEATDMETCIKYAYNEIKDRKGYLRHDGVFVKEEIK